MSRNPKFSLPQHRFVCPRCGIAQLATGRLAATPRCATCAGELHPVRPFMLRDDNVRRQLQESDLPLLVHYWAPGCVPCQTLAPALEQAALSRRDLRFAHCNIEAEKGIARAHGVSNLPTLILFSGGQERARICGTMRLGALLDWLERNTADELAG